MASDEERMLALEQLAGEIVNCQLCGLARNRTHAVPGEGPLDPIIMFIGEAPGWHEDQQGRPFVGPAGAYLEELIASIDLTRPEVYIGNVIKCRPPQNRDPLPAEVLACRPYLDRQVALIRPKIVATLGRYSLARYFPGESISRIHGKERRRDGVIYVPMYHPAAALHQGSLRQTIEDDMKRLIPLIEEARSLEGATAEPQQLRMF